MSGDGQKITFDVARFAAAASAIRSVPEKRNTIPILAHALLEVHGENSGALTVTDLDMWATVRGR